MIQDSQTLDRQIDQQIHVLSFDNYKSCTYIRVHGYAQNLNYIENFLQIHEAKSNKFLSLKLTQENDL